MVEHAPSAVRPSEHKYDVCQLYFQSAQFPRSQIVERLQIETSDIA